jgi:hypothetical protein
MKLALPYLYFSRVEVLSEIERNFEHNAIDSIIASDAGRNCVGFQKRFEHPFGWWSLKIPAFREKL